MLTPLEGTWTPMIYHPIGKRPRINQKKTSFSAEITVPKSDTKCEPTVAIITLNIQCKTTGGKKN
jgi:hypothetical protein